MKLAFYTHKLSLGMDNDSAGQSCTDIPGDFALFHCLPCSSTKIISVGVDLKKENYVIKDGVIKTRYTLFFLNKNLSSNFQLRLGCSYFFWRFQPQIDLELFLFPGISKQWILVARNNKKLLRNTYLLLFHPAICVKT